MFSLIQDICHSETKTYSPNFIDSFFPFFLFLSPCCLLSNFFSPIFQSTYYHFHCRFNQLINLLKFYFHNDILTYKSFNCMFINIILNFILSLSFLIHPYIYFYFFKHTACLFYLLYVLIIIPGYSTSDFISTFQLIPVHNDVCPHLLSTYAVYSEITFFEIICSCSRFKLFFL